MKYFLLALAFLCAGCRNDKPPQLSLICTLDGVGGGDCADPQGKYVYKSPSEMKDYWATTQTDEANFASWCYGASPQMAQDHFTAVRRNIQTQKAQASQ